MKLTLLSLLTMLVVSPIWPLGENPTVGDPFLIVNVESNELAYINDGDIQEVYKVATGKDGDETPTGTFSIIVKAKDPYYRKKDIPGGDPNNPLGTRWIGFNANDTDGRIFGIHGTNRPDSIGQAVTGGCIRLPNEIVEKLFDEIPLGTKIYITNKEETFIEVAQSFGAIES
ncbi:L,D-transpeptidase [Halalkalibacter akibai]|uniref:Protein erfK/srfK n=1 Tax=Halalkalibacter akibai (strain ATCC 43226 / DSM 21942 / CIP 109018 / JCM 9157 / 1139) TaxID=1236973 RepID=W4QQ90_HALA3|nr:L,D-transpeptidase [Halalkalibacter akibai]GAE33494.1 protein erfK/srfK [Halalkalibacter akibai JCM 9157]